MAKRISTREEDYDDIAITVQLCHLCTTTLNCFICLICHLNCALNKFTSVSNSYIDEIKQIKT